MNEYADLLTRVERVETGPGSGRQKPRDASTLVLLDRSGAEPRVLMGRRHERHVFIPDKFVFPGGSVDAADRRMAAAGALDPDSERRLMARMSHPYPVRARAIALAAIRETLEETGLLLGNPMRETFKPPSPAWTAFAQAGVRPDLSALTFVVRAITPPGRSRRFDTRFFLADRSAVAAEIADTVGPDSEFVELKWLTFAEAEAGNLPTISKVVLAEVTARLKAGPQAQLPVPFYYWKSDRFRREEIE